MSIQRAEALKREWTDQYVTVRAGVPELRRFFGLSGRVRTVNMNCRLLIQFETPADISWYDIDPSFVRVLDPAEVDRLTEAAGTETAHAQAPSTASDQSATTKPVTAAREASGSKTAGTSSKTASPLDRIRQQAAGAGSASPAPAASPLDKIRRQAVAKSETGKGTSQPVATKPQPSSVSSPLDKIRSQNAAATTQTKLTSSPPEIQAASEDSKSSVREIQTAEAPANAEPAVPDSAPAPLVVPAATTTTSATTNQNPMPTSLFGQVAAQANHDHAETPAALQASAFDQVRQQANENADQSHSDEADGPDNKAQMVGDEDPVKITFRGKSLPKKDDLQIIEGVGPKIAEIICQAGIDTWQLMSAADPNHLRQLLNAADPRFRMHVPDTWPTQAKLAAEGRWQELEEYQDLLDGGREPGQS